jgi:hypothetical protein
MDNIPEVNEIVPEPIKTDAPAEEIKQPKSNNVINYS